MGIILVIKWFENWFYQKMSWFLSKNVNNKKCAPKLVFFNEKKKMRKIPMIFDIENWL